MACESLLGATSDQGELSYRLTLRLAHLLETAAQALKQLKDAAKAAYNTRSRVVHGNLKLSAERLKNDGMTMEDLTRRAILKCLEKGSPSN